MGKPRVYRSKAYKAWYRSLSSKDRGIVDTRVDTYIELGKLVRTKLLDGDYGLYEFKWDSGMRVYYSILVDEEGRLMLLLVGGNKNSQDRDITLAKNLIRKAVVQIDLKLEA